MLRKGIGIPVRMSKYFGFYARTNFFKGLYGRSLSYGKQLHCFRKVDSYVIFYFQDILFLLDK